MINMRTTPFAYIAQLLALCPLALSGRPQDEIAFSCVPLTTELSDPIMFPGETSDHTHVVVGGTAFQRTMAEHTARNAQGTTCGVEIDKSNYWVPQLYHQMRNGSFEIVEPAGISLYYMNRACNYTEDAKTCDTKHHVPLPPPAGLRMVAGDPFLRTYNDSEPAQRAISHMCIRKDSSSSETKHLPREPCSLTRSQVFFPSCWDGENLDSDDHQSHMAYPAIGDYNKGVCPESHPVAIISIFIEFLLNTEPFPDYENWVYATGDSTGYGLHGDFVNGWTDLDALRDIFSTCTGKKGLKDPGCSITQGQKTVLTPQHKPLEVHSSSGEDVGLNNPIPKLPGNNTVTGPRADEKPEPKPEKPASGGKPNPDESPEKPNHGGKPVPENPGPGKPTEGGSSDPNDIPHPGGKPNPDHKTNPGGKQKQGGPPPGNKPNPDEKPKQDEKPSSDGNPNPDEKSSQAGDSKPWWQYFDFL